MSYCDQQGVEVHPDEMQVYAPAATFDEDVQTIMRSVRDDRSLSGTERYRLFMLLLDMHDSIAGVGR